MTAGPTSTSMKICQLFTISSWKRKIIAAVKSLKLIE